MNIKQYEEEIKKGCGKEYIDEGYRIMCGEMLGDGSILLCPSCQAKLETIQKCKEIFKEMINNSHIEFREDTSKNIKIACGWTIVGLKNDLLSQLGGEQCEGF